MYISYNEIYKQVVACGSRTLRFAIHPPALQMVPGPTLMAAKLGLGPNTGTLARTGSCCTENKTISELNLV